MGVDKMGGLNTEDMNLSHATTGGLFGADELGSRFAQSMVQKVQRSMTHDAARAVTGPAR